MSLGADTDSLRVARHPRLVERVVFVGGLPGCGKTMMTSIVGSLARVEIQKYAYTIEYLCSLHRLGKIEDDVATAMIQMLADLDGYNLSMSREVNFRLSDLSSVFRNPGMWRYVRRLVQPGEAAAVARMRRDRPILNLTLHNALALSPPLFAALEDRLRIVEIVRHPLYMIKQWFIYMDRYGTDERDFGICFDFRGSSLPHFARGWEERYVRSNTMDRVIYAIEHLLGMSEEVWQELSEAQRGQVMVVPFERFVLDPWPSLGGLEALLGTRVSRLTRRELRRQRVPRRMIADGVPEPIYKDYGWVPPERGADERLELARRRAFAAERASPEALAVLDQLSEAYEARYAWFEWTIGHTQTSP